MKRAPANHMTVEDIVGLGTMSKRTVYRMVERRILRPWRFSTRMVYYAVADVEKMLKCGVIWDPQQQKWTMHERNHQTTAS